VKGARAALVSDEWVAEICRRHNDANVICVGARVSAQDALERFVDRFLATPFEGGRHKNRIDKIAALEKASV
jgi:ribose 5-phosphate isomerase B